LEVGVRGEQELNSSPKGQRKGCWGRDRSKGEGKRWGERRIVDVPVYKA
jgi:hypothetical protein